MPFMWRCGTVCQPQTADALGHLREACGQVVERMPVAPAGLQQQDAGGRVFGQPRGQHAARRAAADDDEVVAFGHVPQSLAIDRPPSTGMTAPVAKAICPRGQRHDDRADIAGLAPAAGGHQAAFDAGGVAVVHAGGHAGFDDAGAHLEDADPVGRKPQRRSACAIIAAPAFEMQYSARSTTDHPALTEVTKMIDR